MSICNVLEWFAGIIASLIVVFSTQIINDRVFVPRRNMKELISKVDFTLNYYANVITSPGAVKAELELEASNELRKIAMEFMSFVAFNSEIKYGKITHKELDTIGPELIRLSNLVGDEGHAEMSRSTLSELRQLLYKNNPEAL